MKSIYPILSTDLKIRSELILLTSHTQKINHD